MDVAKLSDQIIRQHRDCVQHSFVQPHFVRAKLSLLFLAFSVRHPLVLSDFVVLSQFSFFQILRSVA
ncbi:hypothetical protein ACN42_g11794 [Penicillium freii]|uniref:Uncharacterized protein n=1 Tax=Penicillium freii TaxID=48697 RepID=A0A117NK46_PENFR|nr:hypothetical protein ACN42_g11794 [Penicillium freii]